MRIFLDANILFSAAKTDGAIRQLLRLAAEAGHECWVDGFVVEEAHRNLIAKAPDSIGDLRTLLSRMHLAPILASDPHLESSLPLPVKDQPVLAAAIRHDCAALVTGDKAHFARLFGKTIHGVAIYSPRSLAEAMLDPGRARGNDKAHARVAKYKATKGRRP